jgi:transcriptional regulator with XRE-family HTH domain
MPPDVHSQMPFGQRLRLLRERAGKSRPVLGGLVGRSAEWVKALESGRLQQPRLPMLIRLAEVLGVEDLAELTGGQETMRVRTFTIGEHPAVPAIGEVVQRYSIRRGGGEPVEVGALRARVADAWRCWHSSPTRRTDVGELLPPLLTDCQDAAASAEGADRRAAHAVLADAYHLTQHALVNAAAPELLWLTVDRAMGAAQVADDPLTLAGGAWTVGMMLRSTGRTDEALQLVHDAADVLEPQLEDGSDDSLAMWGALQLHGAVTAARAGADGDAWAHWDRAAGAARRLPAGYAHPWTMFGTANVDLTGVSLTVDLWRSREALRRAESIDPDTTPSRERRGRLYVEMARGYRVADDKVAAAKLLLLACDEGVDSVRYSPAARAIVDELVDDPPPVIRADVRVLTGRLGLEPP